MAQELFVVLGYVSVMCISLLTMVGLLYIFFPKMREEIKADFNRG